MFWKQNIFICICVNSFWERLSKKNKKRERSKEHLVEMQLKGRALSEKAGMWIVCDWGTHMLVCRYTTYTLQHLH